MGWLFDVWRFLKLTFFAGGFVVFSKVDFCLIPRNIIRKTHIIIHEDDIEIHR